MPVRHDSRIVPVQDVLVHMDANACIAQPKRTALSRVRFVPCIIHLPCCSAVTCSIVIFTFEYVSLAAGLPHDGVEVVALQNHRPGE